MPSSVWNSAGNNELVYHIGGVQASIKPGPNKGKFVYRITLTRYGGIFGRGHRCNIEACQSEEMPLCTAKNQARRIVEQLADVFMSWTTAARRLNRAPRIEYGIRTGWRYVIGRWSAIVWENSCGYHLIVCNRVGDVVCRGFFRTARQSHHFGRNIVFALGRED